MQRLRLNINGSEQQALVEPHRPLLEVLRNDFGLTGTKRGCDGGECASCTVLVDGVSVLSCQLPVGAAAGKSIETIEGLGSPEHLHVLQEAFVEKGAVQCGFCTPGMIIEMEGLLRAVPSPSRDQIKQRLEFHLCRCTGYVKIIEAAEYGARLRSGASRDVVVGNGGYVGRPMPLRDAPEKATGRTRYAADRSVPGMLRCKILRSPYAHAIIKSIDITGAQRLSGVAAIITGQNLRPLRLGVEATIRPGVMQPLLALDRARYIGEPVAAIAADTEVAAEQAAAAIKIEYEVLEPVLTIEEAIAPDAPKVHPSGNVELTQQIQQGNVDDGFGEADAVVENWFYCGYQEHGYLEPEAALAYIDEQDRLVLETCTQFPYHCQVSLAQLLGLRPEQVRVIATPIGGGFGGKYVEHPWMLAALLAYEARRPVRIEYTRAESMLTTVKRHAALMRMKTGATRDGRLVAFEADVYMDVGGYYDPNVARYTAVAAPGPYDIPNVLVNAIQVITNVQKSGAFRGLGGIKVAFAQEQQIDILAEQLGLDPLEVRRKNALRIGSTIATGHRLEEGVGVLQILDALRPHYQEARARAEAANRAEDGKRYGVGVGLGWRAYGGQTTDMTEATVELLADGSVEIRSGLMELGTGATTGVAQIVGELLGVEPMAIKFVTEDTVEAPYPFTTSGEKAILLVGGAAYRAAAALRSSLVVLAGEMLREVPDELRVEHGLVRSSSDDKRIDLVSLATFARTRGIQLRQKGSYRWPSYKPLDPKTGKGVFCDFYAFQGQLAEVEVNLETGDVRVIRVVAACDAGRVINPLALEGLIQGGVLQGLGYALTEEFVPAKTDSLREYGLPTIDDVPEMTVIFVGDDVPSAPFGAKGAGETAIIPTPAAIANAIADATKARVYALPMKPSRVRASLAGEHEVLRIRAPLLDQLGN